MSDKSFLNYEKFIFRQNRQNRLCFFVRRSDDAVEFRFRF